VLLHTPYSSALGGSKKLALTMQQDFADFLQCVLSNPEHGDTFHQNIQPPPGPMALYHRRLNVSDFGQIKLD
jgi:hypothetical protein